MRSCSQEGVKREAALSQEAPLSILGDFACSHHLLPRALFAATYYSGFVSHRVAVRDTLDLIATRLPVLFFTGVLREQRHPRVNSLSTMLILPF